MQAHDTKLVLVGHPFLPIGTAEVIRCAFRAFQAARLSPSILDIYGLGHHKDTGLEQEMGGHLVDRLSPSFNLFFINGDEIQGALQHLGQALPASAYNVIVPNWELSRYPQVWAEQLERFDEIWAPSQFVFDAIQQVTSQPVLCMPMPVQVKLASFVGRRYFDISESAYLFLFLFDFRSFIDRKNPFAIIEAFDQVCAARPNADVRLIIKINRPSNNAEADLDFGRFMAAIEACPSADRITVIDKTFTDDENKKFHPLL